MPSRTVLTSEEYSSWVCYVQTKPPHQPYCSVSFTLGSCIVMPVRRADNLTTFMCRLPWNLRDWTSWNPQGPSRPVMGLPHLILHC